MPTPWCRGASGVIVTRTESSWTGLLQTQVRSVVTTDPFSVVRGPPPPPCSGPGWKIGVTSYASLTFVANPLSVRPSALRLDRISPFCEHLAGGYALEQILSTLLALTEARSSACCNRPSSTAAAYEQPLCGFPARQRAEKRPKARSAALDPCAPGGVVAAGCSGLDAGECSSSARTSGNPMARPAATSAPATR